MSSTGVPAGPRAQKLTRRISKRRTKATRARLATCAGAHIWQGGMPMKGMSFLLLSAAEGLPFLGVSSLNYGPLATAAFFLADNFSTRRLEAPSRALAAWISWFAILYRYYRKPRSAKFQEEHWPQNGGAGAGGPTGSKAFYASFLVTCSACPSRVCFTPA